MRKKCYFTSHFRKFQLLISCSHSFVYLVRMQMAIIESTLRSKAILLKAILQIN